MELRPCRWRVELKGVERGAGGGSPPHQARARMHVRPYRAQVYIGRYLVCGADSASLYLEVVEVVGEPGRRATGAGPTDPRGLHPPCPGWAHRHQVQTRLL
jgi:hypothetical protein